tara:strand:+ start:499 stop:2403 length:1905 start_codon:yes stop_codon:yes gene_type:complete
MEKKQTKTRTGNQRSANRNASTRLHAKKTVGGAPQSTRAGQKKSSNKSRNTRNRRGHFGQPRPHAKKKDDVIPRLEDDVIRIIPLGGVEEIGRNMTAIELNNDIIIVDCGFMFQEDDTPGVDYILPNTQYLEERKEKIKAIVITHGHLDHIGGIPYVADRIGNPPIYTRRLTGVMIKKRQEEFPHLPALDIREVETTETINIGALKLRFYNVTHTIPDSMGVIVKTPFGGITVTGDIKLSHDGTGVVDQAEIDSFSIFKDEDIICMLMDSTNTERPGWSIPEHKVFDTFEIILREAKHRLIVGTFASQLERVIKIIEIAERYDKKIVIEGRSMKGNLEIAKELGLVKPQKGTLITAEQMSDYPESKIVILATGAQGDTYAALMRMANKTHRFITLTKDDTLVLSSSVIPGNERAVQSLKDKIARQGPHIVTYQTSDVHASGHGNAEEAKWIHKQINPKFFIPQHGYHYMLRSHGDLIKESCGLTSDDIVIPDNGTIVEIREKGQKLVRLPVKAPMTTRIVEGLHVRDIQEAVIKDRQALAQDGIFVVVITMNLRTGKLRKSPDIISRGFIYLRESQELLGETRLIIKKTVEDTFKKSSKPEIDDVKNELIDVIAHFLLQKTHKNPIVIPVIVGV